MRVFTDQQELELVTKIQQTAMSGYMYDRATVRQEFNNMAIRLGRRKPDGKPLSVRWLQRFQLRWPQVNVKNLRILAASATKPAS